MSILTYTKVYLSPKLQYTIIGASREKFHRNSAKKRFAKKCQNASYCELEGSHFGLLNDRLFLEFVVKEVNQAFLGKSRTEIHIPAHARVPEADESTVEGDALVANQQFSRFVRIQPN